MNFPSFAELHLEKRFLETLEQLKFTTPTPIQVQALPPALDGKDLIARASTGSGKTAVFALTLLTRLNPQFFGVQALVLCPTRELAEQVAQEIRRLGRGQSNLKVVTLCGGVPSRSQTATLGHGAHVVVGTPGRIQDHLRRGNLVLNGLRTLIFDEADRMLDMGFYEDMEAITARCPQNRQTLLFSATYPARIEAMAAPFLKNPVMVAASETPPLIEQKFCEVTNETRLEALNLLLGHFQPETALIFVNTKVQARAAVGFLLAKGFSVLELSGDLEQKERDEAIALFSGRCVRAIVATDVASRGLDVSSLDMVINFDVSPDPEVHVHRIGRTGRAGKTGLAYTLVSEHEKPLVRRLASGLASEEISWVPLPPAALQAGSPPPFVMFKLADGRKEKIRPADVLGALTADAGFQRDQIGLIRVSDYGTWIAGERLAADRLEQALTRTPIKGKVRRFVRVT
jgi:ATP-independent RNA helicase DbpA